MAKQGTDVAPEGEPQHYVAASARELRAQSVHRLQLGMFGLCAMLLIVGLANIIMDRAETVEAADQAVIAADAAEPGQAVDPLADAGVAPAADPTPDPLLGPVQGATPGGPVAP
jgi:predicted lipid-binding transport protein (Tim44 family)